MNEYFRNLFNKCRPYLDKNISMDILENLEQNHHDQFEDRIAEMLFVSKLLDSSLKIEHKSDSGLDLYCHDIGRSNTKEGWAEVVCPKPAEDIKKSYDSEDEILERITSVISKKAKKIDKDISCGNVKKDQPVILCIDLNSLLDPSSDRGYDLKLIAGIGGLPDILRTIYPISETYAEINLTDKTKSQFRSKYQNSFLKSNGSIISTDSFIKPMYRQISAILFEYNRFGNSYILAHNYFAKNPIKRGIFQDCKEYIPNIITTGTEKRLVIKEFRR